MSLQTDLIFYDALSAATDLMTTIGTRLYSTPIPVPPLHADNTPCPYVIITFDGLNNQDTTKDDPFEGGTDQVNIGIEVAANDRLQLAELTQKIRRIIHDDFSYQWRYDELQANGERLVTSNGFLLRVLKDFDKMVRQMPQDYTFTADAVQYDSMKPCYWQVLHYQCAMYNTLTDYENEQENN
jgi:hypothetical protein